MWLVFTVSRWTESSLAMCNVDTIDAHSSNVRSVRIHLGAVWTGLNTQASRSLLIVNVAI